MTKHDAASRCLRATAPPGRESGGEAYAPYGPPHSKRAPHPHFPRLALSLALLLALTLLTSLGWHRLLPGDEGLYAEAARAMARSDDWVVPRYAHVERVNKPPLYTWLTAAVFRVAGAQEWAARLVPALAGLLGALVVFLLGRALWGTPAGAAAAIVLLSSPWYFLLARSAVTDTLLCAFVTGALASFWGGLRTGRRRYYLLFGAACAAATLTKGPVGVGLPALVGATYLTLGREWGAVRWRWVGAGTLLCLALAAPWFAAVQLRYPGYAAYAFLRENLERYGGRFHDRPFPFFYVPVVLLGMFPWVSALVEPFRRRRRDRAPLLEGREERFLWLWAGVVLVFFSLGRGKLPSYVLPCFPPLALLAGRWWAAALADPATSPAAAFARRDTRRLGICLLLAAAGTGAGASLASVLPPEAQVTAAAWAAAGFAVAAGIALLAARRGAGPALFAARALAGLLVVVGGLQAARVVLAGQDVAPLAERAARLAAAGGELVAFDALGEHRLPFYVGRVTGASTDLEYLPPQEPPPLRLTPDPTHAARWRAFAAAPGDALLERLDRPHPVYCLISRREDERLAARLAAAGAAVVASGGAFLLIANLPGRTRG